MLPPFKQTSLRFVRDFLAGAKDLIKAAEVRHFNVPLYPEFSVEKVLEQVKGDENIMKHLPYYED